MEITIISSWEDYDGIEIEEVYKSEQDAILFLNQEFIRVNDKLWRDCGEKPCDLDPDGDDCQNTWYSYSTHEVIE